MTRPRQLPFDLGHSAAYAREDLWISPANAEVVAWLDKWPEWQAPALVLYGPPASGRTHIARAWAKKAAAAALTVENLEPLCGMAPAPKHLLADDAETLIGDRCAETFLFHAYNRAQAEGGHLLLVAERPPKAWDFSLPDLKSRLLASPAVAIGSPDEQTMAVVLAKLFSDRQIFVSQDVVEFVITRIERSFSAMRDIAEEIDRKALAEKRPVTIPLVREILQAQGILL
ncbi:MAG: DNA replication protein [Alphaproteobacteria bacterium]|nr:MAG: DNA replication protein [Alphaproteobacteria bacterium]